MWGRGRNRANPGIVPVWGRSSSNRGLGSGINLCITHGMTALGSGSGGARSRHGGNDRNGDGRRARVGPVGRGRRRLPHYGQEAVSSTRLHHGWAGEEEDGRRGVFRNDSSMKMREGGGV